MHQNVRKAWRISLLKHPRQGRSSTFVIVRSSRSRAPPERAHNVHDDSLVAPPLAGCAALSLHLLSSRPLSLSPARLCVFTVTEANESNPRHFSARTHKLARHKQVPTHLRVLLPWAVAHAPLECLAVDVDALVRRDEPGPLCIHGFRPLLSACIPPMDTVRSRAVHHSYASLRPIALFIWFSAPDCLRTSAASTKL